MEENQKVMELIKQIHIASRRRCDYLIQKDGIDITKPQFDLLWYLKKNEGREVNAKDIEKDFGLTNPTVAGFLNRLEKKNMIEKKKSSKGSRYKAIMLTKEAEELLLRIKENGVNFTESLLKDIAKEDLKITTQTLEQILKCIGKED